MRQPRGIQRVLQTIWPKQNKHYASQLPVEREMARPAEKREGALSFWGAWPAEGQWGGRSSSNAGESRTLFSDGKNGSSKKKNISSSSSKQMGNKHLQLRQRRRNMRRNSCAITFILFRRLLLPKCVSKCWGQGTSPSISPLPPPIFHPPPPIFPLEL